MTDTSGATGAALLEADQVSVRFGGVQALSEVSVTLTEGEMVGLIGPNGSGKTTLLNVLTGFQRPHAGRVRLSGADATGWSPTTMSRRGVGRTFQAVRLFKELTVYANVLCGSIGAGLRRREARKATDALIEQMGLGPVADRAAGVLSYGERRRVSLVRTFAARPRLVMLDEPAAGLNEGESDALVEVIQQIAGRTGCGVMIVEHDMRVIMGVCRRIHVLDSGRTIAEGDRDQIQSDPGVREAYLGAEED